MSDYRFSSHSNLPVWIEHIGIDWRQTVVYRPQGYPHFHWLQTELGEGEFFVRDKRIVLKEGQGILIAANVPHLYQAIDDQHAWRVNFVTFGGQLVDDMGEIFVKGDYIFTDTVEGRHLQLTINKLLHWLENSAGTSYELSTAAYDLLIKMTAQPAQNDESLISFQKYVTPAIHFLEGHFQEDIQIKEIAQQLFISPQYLGRLFQEFLRVSPLQYLQQIRLTHAKSLLLNQPQLKIQDIAIATGFNSSAYFGKVFLNEIGTSPLKYRKNSLPQDKVD